MYPACSRLTNAIWLLIGIYWLAASIRVKPVARQEGSGSRAVHVLLIALAFLLLFNPGFSLGPLAIRFVPAAPWICWTGLSLTIAGCSLAAWSRVFLGSNWSATVTIKQSHELIRRGPYALVRHPIYAGFLAAVLGTAIEVGEIRGLAALAVAFFGWWQKAGQEEQFLRDQFPNAYPQYCREVKRLIPFLL